MSTSALIAPAAQDEIATLFVGFELSKATWLIGLYSPQLGKTISRYKLDGGDINAALERITVARLRLEKLGKPVRVVSVYEAGYDGFWLHRRLTAAGIENRVVDAASIPVERRSRRRKTDRIDLELLIRMLLALERGETRICRVLQVPTPAEEDANSPAPRAGRAGEGENGSHQPHRRDLDGLGNPRRQSTPARFRAAPRRFGDGHRRTIAGPHQTSAGPRARTNSPDRTPDQRHRTRAGKRDQSGRDAAERAGRRRSNRARWCPSCGIGAPERHWTDQRRATVS